MKDFPMQREWFLDQAKRRVSLGLVLSEIVKTKELHAKLPGRSSRWLRMRRRATSIESHSLVLRLQPQRLAEIEGVVIEDNVVEWALSSAKGSRQGCRFRRTDGSSRLIRNHPEEEERLE